MKPAKKILTAGPSITAKEIAYVTDAVTNGWNENWNSYLTRFEKSFAAYLGLSHALCTSSCTGALHLAMVACGIGPGDEVIVPDLTWIATASAVRYVNATPVFCDVRPDTWTIDPSALGRLITPRTRAIIPVHLYGNPCDMPAVMAVARKHRLMVIEDAAPAVGAEWQGQKAGTWGDIACFSFQGAKLISTGEGGMLLTSDGNLFDRVVHFAEHGRASTGFEITDIGFKYKMSNLQAALGLAQFERIDELIAQKIRIFTWYRERLKDVAGITMNRENSADYRSIMWMTSVVLDTALKIHRDRVRALLAENNIDSRPFFPRPSSFPMFTKAATPVAARLAENGINLPSGHALTEGTVDYICEVFIDIMRKNA